MDEICSHYEKLNMKLNWDMLEDRSANEINDFLCYDGDRLIGFLGLYDIRGNSKEIEITGMVHPDFRRGGIARELFRLAHKECISRRAERLLIISERASMSGQEFIKTIGAEYNFSEYRMRFDKSVVPEATSRGIKLRDPEANDFHEFFELDKVGFGSKEEDSDSDINRINYNSTLVAELDGQFTGKIGIQLDGGAGYIFGFVVKPEFRGLGYGREILLLPMQKLLSKGIKSIILEVAVKNERALTLYKSCGFEVATVYDYFEIFTS